MSMISIVLIIIITTTTTLIVIIVLLLGLAKRIHRDTEPDDELVVHE